MVEQPPLGCPRGKKPGGWRLESGDPSSYSPVQAQLFLLRFSSSVLKSCWLKHQENRSLPSASYTESLVLLSTFF